MPLLPDVWRAAFPAAIAGADPPAIEVGWVRMLKARVPAFDALESGDLAIVPMGALRELVASGGVEATGVVDVVARAAGSGVLLVGVRSDDPLAS
ncbi:MAG: hypothetical protein H0V04_08170, partial [Chloroflexi bacterium]|nr:hypothetical protein [Chloroflexota bacterium]